MESQGLSYYYDEPPMSRKQFIRNRMKTLSGVPSDGPKYMITVVPLRLLIFVMTFVLFSLLVYLSCLSTPELRDGTALLMIGSTTAFLFFAVIHIIGHFGSTATVEYPMIFGSFIGVVCFTFIGAVIAYSAPTRSWARLLSFVLCFIIAFLHATDVLLALGYWRHKYSARRKFGPPGIMQIPFDAHRYNQTSMLPMSMPLEVCKCDVQTSMTGTGIIHDPYDSPFRTHRTKKREAVPNKSYVECPARSGFSTVAARGIQTEFSPVQPEIQTTKIEVKEIPVQTASKCDHCHRHMDIEPYVHKQCIAPIYDTPPPKYPTTTTPPYKSIPIQAVPTHSTPSSSPTRKNLLCLCKHHVDYVPPLSPAIATTGGHCCRSCNCSSLTSGKKSAVQQHQHQHLHQHQPHQTLIPSTPPRRIETTLETNPNFDMSTITTNVHSGDMSSRQTKKHIRSRIYTIRFTDLNVDPGDNKLPKESHRVNEARSSSSRTKPFIGRLAAMSGCLTTSSSSSLHVHKNKRTQTKGQSSKKHISSEKENEVLTNIKNENREPINEEKFIAKEVEVRSINLNSSHRAMPKHESTPKKGVNIKSHDSPRDRNIIVVKEEKKDKEELKPKLNVINKEMNNSGELTPIVFDPGHESISSKTRTKTLYREAPMKPAQIENGEMNRISLKSNNDPSSTDRTFLDVIKSPRVTTESKSHIVAALPIEKAASNRPRENVANKNKTSEIKEELKNSETDETINGSGWRSRTQTDSGSSLFRPGESTKNTYDPNPPKKDSTPRSRKESTTDKSKAGSGSVKDEVPQQLGRIKKEPKANKNDARSSVNNNAIPGSIRKIICPVCKNIKRKNCMC